MDALNQLPNVFIRGEQRGASYYLYRSWLSLKLMWDKDGDDLRNSHTRGATCAYAPFSEVNWCAAQHLSSIHPTPPAVLYSAVSQHLSGGWPAAPAPLRSRTPTRSLRA
jgi:hypothetical protein